MVNSSDLGVLVDKHHADLAAIEDGSEVGSFADQFQFSEMQRLDHLVGCVF